MESVPDIVELVDIEREVEHDEHAGVSKFFAERNRLDKEEKDCQNNRANTTEDVGKNWLL